MLGPQVYTTMLVFGGDSEPPADPVHRPSQQGFHTHSDATTRVCETIFNCSLCQQALLSEKQDEVYEPRAVRTAHELAENVRACFAVSRQKERAFQLRVKNEYLGFLAREKTRYHKTGEWL